jgi:hypothetical protein
MSYSQLMNQMTLDPGVRTSDTRGMSTLSARDASTSALAVKSDQETHTSRLSLGDAS